MVQNSNGNIRNIVCTVQFWPPSIDLLLQNRIKWWFWWFWWLCMRVCARVCEQVWEIRREIWENERQRTTSIFFKPKRMNERTNTYNLWLFIPPTKDCIPCKISIYIYIHWQKDITMHFMYININYMISFYICNAGNYCIFILNN